MKRTMIVALMAALGWIGVTGSSKAKEPESRRKPAVQIALLLDTSNSMDGLIDQAKSQLWRVVNEFIRAKRDGRPAPIQVALYEYGNDRLPAQEGFVRLVVPLTDDLDTVSEKLFGLRTKGGQEYCGQVIQNAVDQLTWSHSDRVYRAIFIAGNEPFSQGSIPYPESCRSAVKKGIVVNTIFCGANAEGLHTGWSRGAMLADGRYISIDQNEKIVSIPTPHDDELARLGRDVNNTYLPYGRMGRDGQARQLAQDANAAKASLEASLSRAGSKGALNVYCNDEWDLVDAIKTGKCKLEDLKEDELPEELRGLGLAERIARVKERISKRQEIQDRILVLTKERETFLAAERKKRSGESRETLDSAIIEAVRSQATRANIEFEGTSPK